MIRGFAFSAVLFLLSTGAVAKAACPPGDRAAMLRTAPERLAGCAASTSALDRIWAAHAAAASGRFDDAARLYAGAEADPGLAPIGFVLAVAAARAELAAGRAQDGLARLQGLTSSRQWERAELAAVHADLLLASGDAAGAMAAARQAIDLGYPAPDILWSDVARAAVALHDSRDFREALHALETDFPESPATASAEQLEVTFQQEKLDPADFVRRWTRWIAQGGASGVAAECMAQLPRISGAASVMAQARLQCGLALATVHDKAAARVLEEATRDPSAGPAALLALARIAARGTDPAPVAAVCTRLAAIQARGEQAECAFLAAFVTLQAGDHPAARAALAEIIDAFPHHPRALDAAWFMAFDTLHSPGAAAAFDRLLKTARSPEDRARALYWHGRVVQDADPARAHRDWELALRLDPIGYYGWLSSTRLAPGATAPHPALISPSSINLPEGARRAALLLEAGFARCATLEMNEILPISSGEAREWLDFLARADQWERVLDIGVSQGGLAATWPPPRDREPLVLATFPRAFPAELSLGAAVDPNLLLALMRRESRFDPDATSAAEAVGLLQLLPRTAFALARDMGEHPPTAEQLHDPAINIHYGAEYVRRLLARFRRPLLTMAAYNAGPKSVADWTRLRAGMDVDEWVERIPFRETRTYVKAVGGAYAAYALIYSGRRPPIDWSPIAPAGAGIDY